VADPIPRYGRRAGWYAMVRAKKPRFVVETGVDKGLGTCVLAAAMLRNAAEGQEGTVVGTDINPQAGFLLRAPYDRVARILYGDSIESLRTLDSKIDLFINDSDHSAQYEAREYDVVAPRLAPGAVLLGDNAHSTDSLQRFAVATGRRFLFFKEEPERHWYPGAGIGVAF
jgi:predicted O-methyltransferase YrrM